MRTKRHSRLQNLKRPKNGFLDEFFDSFEKNRLRRIIYSALNEGLIIIIFGLQNNMFPSVCM